MPSSFTAKKASFGHQKYEVNHRVTASTKPSNLFQLPHVQSLSEENKEAMIEFIDASVTEAHNLCFGQGKVRWCPSRNRSGITTYHGKADPSLHIDMAVKTNCTILGSFDEVMDLLTTESSEDFTSFESAIDPSVFLDGIILKTLVPRTPEGRFICLKWHCTKSLAPLTTKPRDYTYVEIMDHFTDQNGRKFGFQLSKSIEADEIKSDDASRLFLRGKILSFHIFVQIDSKATELHSMLIHNYAERQPAWLINKIEEQTSFRVAKLRDHLNHKRINLLLSSISQRKSMGKQICCSICTKTFSFVRSKYVCAACGQLTCNQCSAHSSLMRSLNGKSRPRMCGKCNATLQSIRVFRNSNAYAQKTMAHEVWSARKEMEDETFISLRSTCTTDTLSIESSEGRMSRNHSARSAHQYQNYGHSDSSDGKSIDNEVDSFSFPDPISDGIASTRQSRANHIFDLGVGKYKAHEVSPEKSGLLERVSSILFLKTSSESINMDTNESVEGVGPQQLSQTERADSGVFSESMALADMQIQLNRMTEVSRSLHAMCVKDTRKSYGYESFGLHDRDCQSYLRTDSEIMSNNAEMHTRSQPLDSPECFVSDPGRASASTSTNEWSEPTQANEEFLSMLPDSVIMDALSNQMEQGWKIVLSRTTGNLYYYNERSGTTLWTEPLLEIEENEVNYMIL